MPDDCEPAGRRGCLGADGRYGLAAASINSPLWAAVNDLWTRRGQPLDFVHNLWRTLGTTAGRAAGKAALTGPDDVHGVWT